jgi:predicted nucleotidyltransferase
MILNVSRELSDDAFGTHAAAALGRLPGVDAVMLGGSRAAGHHSSESDWDFSIYYRDTFDVEHLRGLGWTGEISPLGGWGGGVFNGGAWLELDGRKVDVHYRDLNDVERRIADAENGKFEIEHLSFYVAGIPTYVVVAELALGRVLIGKLPRPVYPESLKRSAAARWQERAKMTLDYADAAYAARGDPIGVAGSAARALLEASHARLASRGTWTTNEKDLVVRAGLGHAASFFEHLDSEPANLRTMIQRVREAVVST